MSAPLSQDAAIDRLAHRLREKLEHLDPSLDAVEWESLSERQRDFYRLCIEDVLLDIEAVNAATQSAETTDRDDEKRLEHIRCLGESEVGIGPKGLRFLLGLIDRLRSRVAELESADAK
jgi:hypothetical protein